MAAQRGNVRGQLVPRRPSMIHMIPYLAFFRRAWNIQRSEINKEADRMKNIVLQ